MSTNKQRFSSQIKQLKTEIWKRKSKLLFITVVLFCLIGTIFSFTQIKSKKFVEEKNLIENIKNDFCLTHNLLSSQKAIASGQKDSNVLASLKNDPTDQNTEIKNKTNLALLNNNTLLNQNNPITLISQQPRSETITYTVQSGDMPSTIAASFGISLNTLLWANDLNDGSIIRPGDELTILPIDGISHRVKDGETVGEIATKYKANTEKIIAFNDLPADGSIQIGQKLIVPDGEKPAPKPKTNYVSRSYVVGAGTGKSRAFPYGQCTWYVAQKRYVPWSGHAKSWLANAQAYGFSTGSIPQAGSIMVMQGGNWLGRVYGHVAYVESISGDWVTISEMNHVGWAIKSVRAIHRNSSTIKGYIY